MKLLRILNRLWLRFRGYTGLNRLDLKLLQQIKPLRDGFFVELGANDGITQSNTFKLQRDYAWSGLLIEPSPVKYIQCLSNRRFGVVPYFRCCACVPFAYPHRFVEIEDVGLMSVAKGLDVTDSDADLHADRGSRFLSDPSSRYVFGSVARTLTSILDEVGAPKRFDLLSLDVEGNELSVLQGLDFTTYTPKWILVETRAGSSIHEYLTSKNYRLFSCLSDYPNYSDSLYLHRSL